MNRWNAWMIAAAITAVGCDDAETPLDVDAGAVGDGAAEAGTGTDLDDPKLAVFAVHLRGLDSSGVGLLNGAGELLDAKVVHSGSLPVELTELASDISLPSSPEADGVLTLLARTPQDAILRFTIDGEEIISQTSTQGGRGGAGFSSNPQDYLFVDDSTAWVTRYEPNLDPDAKDLQKGDDLLKIDPTEGKVLGRVSLEMFRETIDYQSTDWDTGAVTDLTGTAYARPSGIVRAGGSAVIGLDRLTVDFGGQADGAVAILDLETEEVSSFELEGLGNCGTVVPVIGRDDAVLVSCVGVPWGSAATSGVVLLAVDADGEVAIEQRFRPKKGPLAVFFPISLGGTEIAVTESGWATGGSDVLYRVDLADDELTEIYTASGGGVLGFTGAYRPDTGLLLIGDRTEGATGVRRFTLTANKAKQGEMIQFDPALPVDAVHSLFAF